MLAWNVTVPTPEISHPLSWGQISVSHIYSPFMCCHFPSTSEFLSFNLLRGHIRYPFPCFQFLYFFWMCSLRGDLSLPARSRQNQIYTFIPTVSGFNSENILQKHFSIFKHFVESDWTDNQIRIMEFVSNVRFGQVFFPTKNIICIKICMVFCFLEHPGGNMEETWLKWADQENIMYLLVYVLAYLHISLDKLHFILIRKRIEKIILYWDRYKNSWFKKYSCWNKRKEKKKNCEALPN